MSVQQDLVDRVRSLLPPDAEVEEKSMFGVRAVMVDGSLLVGAAKDGGMLVRVDPERHDELLSRPGARQAEMGAGRSMGPSWLRVAAEALADEAALADWVAEALRYNTILSATPR